MEREICRNQNHSKMNISVRHCSSCGEVVNQKVKSGGCSTESHNKSRKLRDLFCVDCGKNLRDAN